MKKSKVEIINLINSNKFNEAEKDLKTLLGLDPNNPDYNFFYGLVLAQKKNFAEAIIFFQKVRDEKEYRYDSNFNTANCYQALGKSQNAIELFELCIIEFPTRHEPYQKLASCYQSERKYEKAINLLNKSIEIQKTDYSYFLLGNIFREMGSFDLALDSYRKSLKINSNFLYSEIGISKIFADLGEFQRALDNLINLSNHNNTPLKIKIDAKIDIGNIYKSMGNYPKSIDCYKEVLGLDNKNPHASYGMALSYLYQKKYSLGWAFHESRLSLSTFGVLRGRLKNFSKPLWNNNKPKKKLLIWGEQGIGESILYSQFTDVLLKEFEEISLATDKKLVPFFKKIYPSINIFNIEEIINFKNYDHHLPMGSIGLYFQNQITYQLLKKKASYPVRFNINKQQKLRCGISWASGNKIFGHKKTIKLDLLKDIFLNEQIEFINIQFNSNEKEISKIEQDINTKIFINHDIDCYSDIDGVASLISSCDFVITVSNSNAHISGKLGIKTFLLLPHSDGKLWYWGENNDENILWYPSIRPIRQRKEGIWMDCISDLKKEIEKLL